MRSRVTNIRALAFGLGLFASVAQGQAGDAPAKIEKGHGVPVTFYTPGDPGKPLVQAEERLVQEGDLVRSATIYKDDDGVEAQIEECVYDPKTLAISYYRFEDKKSGELSEVIVEGERARTKHRADATSSTSTDEIAWGPQSFAGKIMPELLRRNWAALMAGDEVRFDLYLPFRMSTIGFRLVRHDETLAGGAVSFRAEPSNWIIRQFAPTVYFTYDAPGVEAAKLVHFRGPASVAIDGKKHRTVEARF